MINKMQALNLTHGDELHYGCCRVTIDKRGGEKLTQERWRVSGQAKTWKTRPMEFRVPVKHGMYQNAYLTHQDASEFHLASMCAPYHQCPECKWTEPCSKCHARNVQARKEAKL